MVERRGQQATDWEDVYEMRRVTPGTLPYIRPNWVRDELAQPGERAWPLVAVDHAAERARVVARMDVQLGWARRGHCAYLAFEQHPDYVGYAGEPGRELLREAIQVAENWWNKRRLQVTVPVTDPDTILLFESFDFVQEARLRQGVRIAGELVDEIVLARVTGDAAQPQEPTQPPPAPTRDRNERRPDVNVRGGSTDDWEAYHAIWSQPSVIWGTMQIPHTSADWNRERVQKRQSPRFWPLAAEVEGKLVGTLGLHCDEHNRAHVGHIGMMVHHDYQGLGVGSALMEAVVDLADNWLGMSRLQLEVYPDNERAIGLYEKYGFETEGLYRAFGFRDGRYVDTLVMGRLR
jgi:putative acetyltransferase